VEAEEAVALANTDPLAVAGAAFVFPEPHADSAAITAMATAATPRRRARRGRAELGWGMTGISFARLAAAARPGRFARGRAAAPNN
jgi:hypothetical protein